MDRNLGARDTKYATTGYGNLTYQFGRKDPIAGGISGTLTTAYKSKGGDDEKWIIAATVGPVPIPTAVGNPMALYTKGSSSAWASGVESESYLWNDYEQDYRDGGKSIFDPSPLGWKVAPHGTWSGLTNATMTDYEVGSSMGYPRIDSFAYYPVHGYRSGTTGNLTGFNTTVVLYSSSPISKIGIYGFCVYPTTGIVSSTHSCGRTDPHTVRCVQHNE